MPQMIIKIKLLVVLFLVAFTNDGWSQLNRAPAKVSWGEEIREPAGSRIIKIIDTGLYGFYALRKREAGPLNDEQVFLELYDSNYRLKKSKEIDLKYKGKLRDFEDLVMVEGKLYLLTSFNNQSQKKNYLFYQTISDKMIVSKKLNYIAEIETKNRVEEGLFDLEISQDSSKILVYNELPFKKNTPEQFTFRVFDHNFAELWTKNVVLPYNDDQFIIEKYTVDNEGNVFLLGVLFKDKAVARRRGLPNYQYVILSYTQKGEKKDEYKIGLHNKFITDLTFKLDNQANLVCSGFYSEKGTYSIKGTYFFKINTKTKEVNNQNLKEFDFEFLTEYMRPGEKRRAEKAENSGNINRAPELYRFSLDELILRSDGGAVLIAEQYYVYERFFRYFDGTIRYDYYYNYNDIIVVNIRPDGSIEWTARIPKRQETLNDGGYFSSYAMSIVKDRIFFIFNDNPRNFEVKNNGRYLYNYNGRQSVVALVEVKKDGSIADYPLFFNVDASITTRPKISKQIGSRKMMIYGERNRKYRFAKLDFII